LLVLIVLFVVVFYVSTMVGRSWCDHEKELMTAQSNRQLELELTKLRQCIEEKATMQQKLNDLQWEVEKYKRSNADLQSDNEQLQNQVNEYSAKYESSLQEIQKLKVEVDGLLEKHDNIQQAIHDHIGHDGPQLIADGDDRESHKMHMIEQPEHGHLINNGEEEHPDPVLIAGDDGKEIESVDEIKDLLPNPFARNAVSVDSAKIGIAVVIFCYNRHSYLERTLESLFSILPPSGFSVFVSQQGFDEGVTEVIKKYSDEGKAYWLGFDYESTDKRIQPGFSEKRWLVYHKIAAHYKFALQYLFDDLKYDKVISLEDDMEMSPDFFSYFESLGKVMDSDRSVFCVSAWNDYGQRDLVHDPKALYRTDIFPGLGWMWNKDLWAELGPKWPLAFWDDWLREAAQRRNRSCIRPEMNRVYTFGSSGSSEGLFFNKYLKKIQLNQDDIDWSSAEIEQEVLSKISPDMAYDEELQRVIEQSRESTIEEVKALQEQPMPLDYVVRYSDLGDYTVKSKHLSLMDDHKDGVPRQSYRGIVVVRWKTHRILFVPDNVDWTQRTYQ